MTPIGRLLTGCLSFIGRRMIQDYLGHKNIKNTARYTRTSARGFERLGLAPTRGPTSVSERSALEPGAVGRSTNRGPGR